MMVRPSAAAAAVPARILDAVLARAAEVGWARVRLHEAARSLGIGLDEVYRHYADLDAVGEALLARADVAMLALAEEPGFAHLPVRDRLHLLIACWLDSLAPHRAAVAAFLGYKFRPAHVHMRRALIVRLSRTVQWLRAAAGLDAAGRRKDLEEVGLSLLFVATVLRWLGDRSEDQERTRRFLEARLAAADTVMALLWPPRGEP